MGEPDHNRVDSRKKKIYSIMGVITLLFGLLGILAQIYGIQTLIVILILLGFTGAAVSYFLPETSTAQGM